jgi:hypothetical protein
VKKTEHKVKMKNHTTMMKKMKINSKVKNLRVKAKCSFRVQRNPKVFTKQRKRKSNKKRKQGSCISRWSSVKETH